LGTGAIVKRPMVVTDADGNDSIAIRHMMYLSALVLKAKGATTVVTGTASFGQLTKMAEALKTS
ncbi:hypothetical protein ABZV25_03535, partial [Micrococcus luteus]